MADGRFRTDLYHRLRVLPLRVPSLAERTGDLPVLIRRVMEDIAEASGRKVPALAPDALAALAGYAWPGNVRELGHVLERAVLNTDGPVLIGTRPSVLDRLAGEVASGASTERPTLDALERRYVAFVLKETRGNQSRAAAILGISRKALWEKRKRYGME